ncbi:MAG: hypothetical protein AB8B83_03455 [Bdellovibrionales bacterium]
MTDKPSKPAQLTDLQLFAARRADADATRRGREANEANAAHVEARATLAQQVKDAEDNERDYSPLVERVKKYYDTMMMSEGICLDVHLTGRRDDPIQIFQVTEENRTRASLDILLISLDLDKPFSGQWPKKLDGLDAFTAVKIQSERGGMYGIDSRWRQHLSNLPQRSPGKGVAKRFDEESGSLVIWDTDANGGLVPLEQFER